MDCVFFGTPDFAVSSLKALIFSEKYHVKAVFTQPDKKVGRKQTLTQPHVKAEALSYGISVFQPERIRDSRWVEILKEINPDVIVTAAFGQILSKEILDIPKFGTINVHASLLPAYRGPAPIQWALINGEKVTGVTTMLTDEGIDTGDILLQKQVEILPDETAGELFERLSDIGSELLIETLDKIEEIIPTKQDENKASYFPMLKKDMAKLDFNKTADEVCNLIRGLNPWPEAFFCVDDLKIKVVGAKIFPEMSGHPGEVLRWDTKEGIVIACKEGAIRILKLQAASKRLMDAHSFVNGKKIEVGRIL